MSVCFRPLAGSKVPERRGEQRNAPKSGPVSVPSRGLRYLNLQEESGHGIELQVSVPFRGIYIIGPYGTVTMAQVDKSFRPLAGSKVSEHQRQRLHLNQNRFRPLSGSKVSEQI